MTQQDRTSSQQDRTSSQQDRTSSQQGNATAQQDSMTPQYHYIASSTQLAVQRMSEESETRGYTDVFKWSLFMAADVIGEASFGESFKMLQSGEKNQYTRDLELVGASVLWRQELAFMMPLLNLVGLRKKMYELSDRMAAYANQSLDRYWRLYQEDPDNVKRTLLTKASAVFEAGEISQGQISSHARANLIAGADTTSNTLTSAIYLLSANPKLQLALSEAVATLPTSFTNEDIRKHVPLAPWVINETLRLRGPVGQGLPRRVPPTGTVLNSIPIPGGVTIGVPAYTAHRDASTYSDPETFNPYRWSPENITPEMKDAFLPFGGGNRICLGMHFAETELYHALCNFSKAFPNGVEVAEGVERFNSDKEMSLFQSFLSNPRGRRLLVRERK